MSGTVELGRKEYRLAVVVAIATIIAAVASVVSAIGTLGVFIVELGRE
jgi:hypothetical protein